MTGRGEGMEVKEKKKANNGNSFSHLLQALKAVQLKEKFSTEALRRA